MAFYRRMFTLLIFVVVFVNLINLKYYQVKTHRMAKKIETDIIPNRVQSSREEQKMKTPLIKVILMRKAKLKKIKRIKLTNDSWTPEYMCGDNLTSSSKPFMPLCPEVPPLLGPMNIKDSVNVDKINEILSSLGRGGSYTPSDCDPTETIAVIVPYRGLIRVLLLFVYSLHLSLIKQKVAYQIFVVKEYNETHPLNPGVLYNIGFIEALKARKDAMCVVFHDPFLVPTDSSNSYRCSGQPKQLVASIDNVPYEGFGGVIALRPRVFRAVNGFSNLYLDTESVFEELCQRLVAANYTIIKPSPKYANYNNILTGDEQTTVQMTQSTLAAVTNSVDPEIALEWPDGLTNVTYSVSYPLEFKFSFTLIEIDSTRSPKPLTDVTISTRSSNPLYDETTTPSTTSSPILNMSLKVRTRILGRQ